MTFEVYPNSFNGNLENYDVYYVPSSYAFDINAFDNIFDVYVAQYAVYEEPVLGFDSNTYEEFMKFDD